MTGQAMTGQAMTGQAMTGQALSGLLVVDLTTEIDGPYSTKLLADLGARVVKVEPLEGDPARRLGPFPTDVVDEEASGLFLYLNANKESVTADITRPAGRDLVAALAARADVLVENFEPGAMARYGLSFEALHSANRRLVVT
jgi:CoA:oxalate CoA-transferase